MRIAAAATLAIAIVSGIALVYSTGIPNVDTLSMTTTKTQSTNNNQNQTSSSSNPATPPDISQYCKLPSTATNSSGEISMTISNPLCGYFTSTDSYGGGIEMVSNETFDVAIRGPPSTTVSLTVPGTPFGAAWFFPDSSVTTDSQGDAGTTLYLAGMLANPQASSKQTVELQAKAPDPSSVSLVLPVVESSTVTGLNPISKITLPAHLFVDAANLSKGASYRTPFGVVYLPTSPSSLASLPLSISVIGLASGNVTSEGPIQPMPAWLNVWFADGEGNKITSLNLPRYNIEFIFLTSNTTMALPPNTMNSYYVAIQVQEGGTSFTEAVNIVVQGAISTGGPAQTTG